MWFFGTGGPDCRLTIVVLAFAQRVMQYRGCENDQQRGRALNYPIVKPRVALLGSLEVLDVEKLGDLTCKKVACPSLGNQ